MINNLTDAKEKREGIMTERKRKTDEEILKDLEAKRAAVLARMSNKARQKRNGELIALGIALEQGFGKLSPVAQREIESLASGLDSRNKARFTDAIERVSGKNHPTSSERIEPADLAAVRIDREDVAMRTRIKKEAGGRWDPEKKVWWLPASKVVELGLQDRVI